MIVRMDHDWNLKGIEFCCNKIGDLILSRDIVPLSWSDHIPRFVTINYYDNPKGQYIFIDFCPNCGTKVEGKFLEEKVS